jgi:hypothetical protein
LSIPKMSPNVVCLFSCLNIENFFHGEPT